MEGLIKGLINVALDAVVPGDADDHQRRRQPPEHQEQGEGQQRNQQARASWAEVASSGGPEQVNESQGGGDWEVAGGSRKNHRQLRPGRPIPTGEWSGYKVPASEQKYSPEADAGVDVEPTEEELNDLSKACNRLWELDLNGLTPGEDYLINCGEGKKAYQGGDMAAESLFSWVKDDVFSRPTYSRFCSLLDNYEPSQGRKENVTQEEKNEQDAFIEEISRTSPVKYLYRCLVLKGALRGDYDEFKRALKSLWFDLYGRGGVSGSSSAFEHVFVGEIKEEGEVQVSGFHNWIQFYMEESKGRVDYRGYIFPRRRGESPDEETKLLTIQFEWLGVLKAVSSTLIGVSPEFELALYTLCFYLGREDNHIYLGPYAVNVKCYRHAGGRLGSAFPISES